MINYYETLGVEASASADEIKAAHRALVKRYHPDVPGGDPVRFARVMEAYEVLSEPARRKAFDEALRAREHLREARLQEGAYARARPEGRSGAAAAAPWPLGAGAPGGAPPVQDAGPPFTRVMSVVMPPGGRFLLEGLNGEFTITPTAPAELWETTRQKFPGEDVAALARRVVQIRLHGPRELVRQLRPMPVEFGVQLQGMGKEQFLAERLEGDASMFAAPRGSRMEQIMGNPVQLKATVPPGVAVYLYDLSGKITVGDLQAELVATLDDRTFLRAGAVTTANVTLTARSKAHLASLAGPADIMLFGQGQMLVQGQITRLRAVLEHEAHLEITGAVEWLQATVSGRAYLNAKATVARAHVEARAGAYARLAKVTTAVQVTRSGAAGVDVIEGPPAAARPRVSAGAMPPRAAPRPGRRGPA
jgi:hypothetical protein